MKTEGLSRQQKRLQTRQAAKTIGKLNHILKNPAQTVGDAKMQNKNITQYVGELQAMGVIKPPSLMKRIQAKLKQYRRATRLSLGAIKIIGSRAWHGFWSAIDRLAMDH